MEEKLLAQLLKVSHTNTGEPSISFPERSVRIPGELKKVRTLPRSVHKKRCSTCHEKEDCQYLEQLGWGSHATRETGQGTATRQTRGGGENSNYTKDNGEKLLGCMLDHLIF